MVRFSRKARQIIRNNKSDHPWLLVNEEQMLRDSVLVEKRLSKPAKKDLLWPPL
jgi:hypothetical protein